MSLQLANFPFLDDNHIRSPDSAFFDDNNRDDLSYQDFEFPGDDCLVETSDPSVFAGESSECPEIMDFDKEFDKELMYLNEDVFDDLAMENSCQAKVTSGESLNTSSIKSSDGSNDASCHDCASSSVSEASDRLDDVVHKLRVNVNKVVNDDDLDEKPDVRSSDRVRLERKRSVSNCSDYCYDLDFKANNLVTPGKRRGRPRVRKLEVDSDWSPSSSKARRKKKYEESPSADPLEEKSRKNAVIAKKNRERKKIYIWELENKTSSLEKENKTLKSSCEQLKQCILEKESENRYLRNVLANQSSLSSLLKGLTEVKTVRVKTSFAVGKGEPLDSSGVCLHVSGTQATLEFCAKCAENAKFS